MKALIRPIYLDYNATTPVDPLVIDAMLPFLREAFGNPSSVAHSYGWEANQAVETARKNVAHLIGCQPREVIWTSGATESNNLAIFGALNGFLRRKEKAHFITSQVEHKAVCEVAKHLEAMGVDVTYVPVDRYGQVSVEDVSAAIRPHTRLISIIMGQNEVGTLNPIREIGRVAKDRKIPFHVDGAQAVGKTQVSVEDMGIDFLSASGHKMYAPKGVGFLYVRKGYTLEPLIFGGTQEHGVRPGTLNVPSVVGMGKACEIFVKTMNEEIPKLSALRDEFIREVLDKVPSARLNGHPTERLYSNVSLSFEGLSSDLFALGLSGLAVSTGSACSAGAPSHILPAMGVPETLARATVRFSLGRFTTKDDLKVAAQKIIAMTEKNRVLSKT